MTSNELRKHILSVVSDLQQMVGSRASGLQQPPAIAVKEPREKECIRKCETQIQKIVYENKEMKPFYAFK
jgi:hypothetical protein